LKGLLLWTFVGSTKVYFGGRRFATPSGLMMGMDDIILDRISFGGVKELQEIYE
jgi:hypothetical protein